MTLRLLLISVLASSQVAAQVPTGTWEIELWLDSATSMGPRPTARHARGTLRIDTLHTASGESSSGGRWTRRFWPGRFAIDLRPFFGSQIAQDVSTTVDGGFTNLSASELEVEVSGDTLSIDFIPAVSHGGISARGAIRGDSLSGMWETRAYCCGATGRFRMVRTSAVPVTFRRPPPPPPPKPLDPSERTEVRVRILDLSTGRYFEGEHSLETPSRQSTACCYSTGTEADGWGTYFWLRSGAYSVTFSRFECAGRFAALRTPVREAFVARPADTLQITLRVHLDTVALKRTYDNTDSLPCRALRDLPPPGGA